MTHWPKSLRDIAYRAFLLRRLILVCAALIWTGLAVSYWVYGPSWTAQETQNAVWVCLFGLLGPAILAVLFPSAWIDVLAMSAATALSLIIAPSVLASYAHLPAAGVWALMILATLGMTCLIVWLICKMHGVFPMGELRTYSNHVLSASADSVMNWEFAAPLQKSGLRRTGPVDADGRFPIYYGFLFPDPEDFTISPETNVPDDQTTPDALACILEKGPRHQVTQYMRLKTGTSVGFEGTLVALQTVEPIDADRCRYICEEVHDVWDFVTWAAAWLNDQSRDYYRELDDALAGVPTTAVRHLPQITPLVLLARWITKLGLDDPHTSSGSR